jgi:hypothetical protein
MATENVVAVTAAPDAQPESPASDLAATTAGTAALPASNKRSSPTPTMQGVRKNRITHGEKVYSDGSRYVG